MIIVSALERLAALERVAHAAATPGPWAQLDVDPTYVIGEVGEGPDGPEYLDVADCGGRPQGYPRAAALDAALIVAAVNALPGLTAAVRNVLHRHVDSYDEDTDSCRHCNWTWPCPTVRDVAVALDVDPGAMT